MIPPPGRLTPRPLAIPSSGGRTLAGWWWAGTAPPRGVIVVGHGLCEHALLYLQTVHALLASLDVAALAFDFRGHGLSPGRRGVVQRYDEFADDWHAALHSAARLGHDAPTFALGHSNGGLSALLATLEGRLPCHGLILSNPALRVRMAVPAWKEYLGRFLHRFAPWVTLSASIRTEDLTRDPAEQIRRQADTLCHNRISAPLYFGMKEAADRIEREAARIAVPLLLLLGEADPIIDPAAGAELAQRATAAETRVHVYPDMRHEPLCELGREQVWADVIAWLRPRLAPAETA